MTTITTEIAAKGGDNYNPKVLDVTIQMNYDMDQPTACFAGEEFPLSELESIVADMKYVKEKEEA